MATDRGMVASRLATISARLESDLKKNDDLIPQITKSIGNLLLSCGQLLRVQVAELERAEDQLYRGRRVTIRPREDDWKIHTG